MSSLASGRREMGSGDFVDSLALLRFFSRFNENLKLTFILTLFDIGVVSSWIGSRLSFSRASLSPVSGGTTILVSIPFYSSSCDSLSGLVVISFSSSSGNCGMLFLEPDLISPI